MSDEVAGRKNSFPHKSYNMITCEELPQPAKEAPRLSRRKHGAVEENHPAQGTKVRAHDESITYDIVTGRPKTVKKAPKAAASKKEPEVHAPKPRGRGKRAPTPETKVDIMNREVNPRSTSPRREHPGKKTISFHDKGGNVNPLTMAPVESAADPMASSKRKVERRRKMQEPINPLTNEVIKERKPAAAAGGDKSSPRKVKGTNRLAREQKDLHKDVDITGRPKKHRPPYRRSSSGSIQKEMAANNEVDPVGLRKKPKSPRKQATAGGLRREREANGASLAVGDRSRAGNDGRKSSAGGLRREMEANSNTDLYTGEKKPAAKPKAAKGAFTKEMAKRSRNPITNED